MKKTKMKTAAIISSSALMLIGLNSCANHNSAAKNDAATGALLGAAAGGVIGHQSGKAREGAAIGAAVGGSAGYMNGNEKDKRANR